MSDDTPQVLLDVTDGVATITINRPQARNALNAHVRRTLPKLVQECEDRDDVDVMILTGADPAFSAGVDLKEIGAGAATGDDLRSGPPEGTELASLDMGGRSGDGRLPWRGALPPRTKLLIGAVNGVAVTGGLELALACDLIIAAEGARFTMSYGRAGLLPDGGGLWHLARALPRAQVLQMLWLPEPMTARQWHALGLVNAITDDGQALAQALQWAERLAAMAANALAGVKSLVEQAPDRDLSSELGAEREQFIANLFHPNGGEGLAAFFEKRRPKFG